MKAKYLLICLTVWALCGFTPETKTVIYTIGDSTMANKSLTNNSLERGWGQVLAAYLDSRYVEVDNHARNGRSSLSFRNEGLWAPVLAKIKPGDYVLIQFGHNDAKPSPDRHTEPGSTFNEQLSQYVLETRSKGGIPVLLTPMVRRKFDEAGQLTPTHGDYPQAVRDVAAALDVLLIDHTELSRELVQDLGPEASKELFMWVEAGSNLALPQGREDDTHLRALGAKRMARLVLNEIKEKIPALTLHVRDYDYVVAQDGSGDFFSVQEAINAVPDFRKNARTTIYIRNGVYKEKLILPESKINVSFIGESRDQTILTYDDYAQKLNVFGESKSTSGSSSFYVYAPDFQAENISFQNSAGPVGQAVAIFVSGDRAVFKNCRFLGCQDTLYTYGKNSRQYYENCYIEGTVDFIFGSSTAVFKDCEIRSKRDAFITAASTPQHREHGYVFINCKLTADEGVNKVYLGRPWRPYAQTVFIDCEMGAHIRPEGWHNWGNSANEKTAFYTEFGSTGPGADAGRRVRWAKKLNKKRAAAYTLEKVLAGEDAWNPLL